MNTIFVFAERCLGCKQCELACAVAHSQSQNPHAAMLEQVPPRSRIFVEPGDAWHSAVPSGCRHCEPAPCLTTCLSGAIRRAEDLPDALLRDARRCIACGMCAMVCPFGVVSFHRDRAAPGCRTVALKCDFCLERRRQGRIPACVEACKTGALAYGDINEILRTRRQRQSRDLSLAAQKAQAEVAPLPPAVQAWRAWGRAVARLNAAEEG